MSELPAPEGVAERHVQIPLGGTCRVWEKGSGETLAIFAGGAGYQRWSPFMERVAQQRKVVLISQPGYPGSNPGHHELDDTTDWITMGLDLLEAAGVKGADLLGESAGGMLAAELAAFSEQHITSRTLQALLAFSRLATPPRTFIHLLAQMRLQALLAKSTVVCIDADPGGGTGATSAGTRQNLAPPAGPAVSSTRSSSLKPSRPARFPPVPSAGPVGRPSADLTTR